jgi:hypothetical protein
MRVTIAAVNKALKAAGHPEELVRGNGYFYFAEGDAMSWYTSSVYVYRLDSYTVAEWVEQRNHLANANR